MDWLSESAGHVDHLMENGIESTVSDSDVDAFLKDSLTVGMNHEKADVDVTGAIGLDAHWMYD